MTTNEPSVPLTWWQTRWFVVIAVVLAGVPLIRPDIPPLVDLLGHMGRYRVQIDGGQHPWIAGWYGFHWSLIGNLGIDLLIEMLAPLLGIELAVKVIVMAIPMLTAIGFLWIAREVHGRVPPTALFALALVYNFPFQFGFVNFALATALALNAFGLWLMLARHGRIRLRAVLFTAIGCLLWLCHVCGWAILGLLAFAAELIRARDANRPQWGIPAAILACLPLALPVLLMAIWRGSGVAGGTGDWFHWSIKFLWLAEMLRDRWMWFDVACLLALTVPLLYGVRNPALGWSPTLALAALLLLAAFVIVPRILLGSAYADMRLAPYLAAVSLLALAPRAAMSSRLRHRLALAGLALFVARIAGTTISYDLFDRRYDRELAALDHVPVGARLVSFVGVDCDDRWMMSRLDHLPSIALVRRLAYSNDQWSLAGAQLLTVRYRDAGRFIADPSQFVTEPRCPAPGSTPIDRSLREFPRAAFDYVWLINPPPYDPSVAGDLRPIWRSGTSVLLRVDHNAPPIIRGLRSPGSAF